MEIGEKIKLLRIRKNLTQQELADRCELSKGFISQVESNASSPSITTLKDILESLGSSLKEFFSDSQNDKIVFGEQDVSVQEKDETGQLLYWIVPNAQKNMMEPILLRLKPRGRSDNYGPHAGEVFGYIVEGEIKLHVGSNVYSAKEGESFYYEADWPYYIENAVEKESRVLWVTSPPNF